MNPYDALSLRRAIAELERWAGQMVLWFKPQFLPLPVITIQGGHRLALGWFAWSRWESRDGAILDEINFVPEHLGRDVFDIAETLLHELVHLANYAAGVKDCSSNQYHNRRFRDRALAVGLSCERLSGYGWAKTGLTPALRERIAAINPDASAFDLFRLPPSPRRSDGVGVLVSDGGGAVGVQTRKKKLRKWSCLGQCASVWVASGTASGRVPRLWRRVRPRGSDRLDEPGVAIHGRRSSGPHREGRSEEVQRGEVVSNALLV